MQRKNKLARTRKARVLIVDDHPILREGLAQTINSEKDLVVCAKASTAQEAMAAAESRQPDIAIIDIVLKESNGLVLVEEIKKQHPDVPVLMLSMHDETVYAERALKAGANGYVMKDKKPEVLLEAVREVLNGAIYISKYIVNDILSKVIHPQPENKEEPMESLSRREKEIILLIGKGLRRRDIASKLFISPKTVETHRRNIIQKLNLKHSQELTVFAAKLIEEDVASI